MKDLVAKEQKDQTEPLELSENHVSNIMDYNEISVINFVEDYIDGDIFSDIFSDNSINLLYTNFKGNVLAFLLHKYKTTLYRDDIDMILQNNYGEDFSENFIKIYDMLNIKTSFIISDSPVECITPENILIYIEDEASFWICNVTYKNEDRTEDQKKSEMLSSWHDQLVDVLDNIGEIYEEFIIDYQEYVDLVDNLKIRSAESDQLDEPPEFIDYEDEI